MVNLKDVRASNQSLQSLPPGLVAVFAGATDGIGLGALRQFAKYVNGPIAFIIGRSEKKASHIIDELKALNPMGTFQFIEAQFSLIHEVDRICEEIKQFTAHIDILCMSTGYLTFEDRKETTEGIEAALALQYYSRIRLIINLLSLLAQSVSPRVISIFVPGSEEPIKADDLDSINKLSVVKAIGPAATMTTLAFEELAAEHPNISFIHSYPGWVDTDIMNHLFATTPGALWGLAQIPRFTVLPVLKKCIFISTQESGDRTLFLATSSRYPPAIDHEHSGKLGGWVERPAGVTVARSTVMHEGRGNGFYRTGWNGEVLKESKMLNEYRQNGTGKVVLEHTLKVFERVLERQNGLPLDEQIPLMAGLDFDLEI